MSEEKNVLKQLELLENWPLISHKKNVIRYLKDKINSQEKITGILEGFFSDQEINNFDTAGGVLVLTNKQLYFIAYEKKIQKNFSLEKIKSVKPQKKYSSINLIFQLNDYEFNFRSFFSSSKVKLFVQKINEDYDITDTSIKTADSDPLDNLLQNSPLAGLSEKLDSIIQKTSVLEKKFSSEKKDLNFLFTEAKKIHELLIPILKENNLKELILNDLITLATLSTLSDKKLNRNEAFFIILVLFDFDNNNSLENLSFKKDLFMHNHFQGDANQFIENNKNVIMDLLKNQQTDNDEILKLHSLVYVKEHDKIIGSTFHDILVSVYLDFTQCIIKADGTITEQEKRNLKNIQYLISNASTINPEGEKTASSAQKNSETSTEKEETLEEVMEEINDLIGMKNIKDEISTFINLIKIQKERKERNLPITPLSLHAVFYGPPGTGKTTIARILGRIYKCLGLLKKGHLTETDRAGLVAGYVGQTAIKTDELIQKSLDGILFIDEAYTLSPGRSSGQDFGQEAIDTILKRMEDYRERFVVIVAGYPDEMKDFITSNPGLKSRFSRYFYFNHYEPKQLLDIFYIFSKKAKFILDKEAEKKLLNLFKNYHSERDKAFGNGRLVRNIFEKIIERQANRIAEITPLTEEILCTIKETDIPKKEDVMN